MSLSWEADYVREFSNAKFGEKENVKKRYADAYGVSVRQLERIAKAHGLIMPRKQRSDKGKCALTEEQILSIASLMDATKRQKKGVIMPVEKALEVAEDNGLIERGCISVDRLQQLLRERGLNKKGLDAPDPHVQMQSDRPNEVHLFDVSACIQYYFVDGKVLHERDEALLYKNKLNNFKAIKKHLLRYLLVDHCSGAFFLKYYYDAGENQTNLFDFLYSAWAKKDDDRFPFRGKPEFVLMDAGAANTSGAILSMLKRMDIDIPKSMPKNPRRQGAVETIHNTVERWFESVLRLDPAIDLETLNANAFDWCMTYNTKRIHTRHLMSRFDAWLKIKPDQLVDIPSREMMQDLFSKPEEPRKVNGSQQITYKGLWYSVAHVKGVYEGVRVKVILRPFDYPAIGVSYNGEEYICEPLKKNEFGFTESAPRIGKEYKPHTETPVQQQKKQMHKIAHGTPEKPKEKLFGGLKVFGHQAEKLDGMPTYMPRKGTPFQVDKQDVMEKKMPIIKALKRIASELGSVTPDFNSEIKSKYGETISVEELNLLIKSLRDGSYGKEDTSASTEALSG